MADSIRDLFFGTPANELVEAIEPRRTFDDVILPPATRRALDTALAQVTQHDLIFKTQLRKRSAGGIKKPGGTIYSQMVRRRSSQPATAQAK